ncbi:V-type ATP synthase subunit E [bacterium]|nr:V-type ATP synthase subunit E [bacterium]
MSLDKILVQINTEAQQKAEQILLEAKEKAEQIKRESLEDSRLKKEAILDRARQDAQDREKRMVQMARLSGRKSILAEKQKAINFIFNSAMNRLAGLNPGKYKQILRHMLIKAVRSGREEIILPEKDKKLIDDEWLKGVNREISKARGLPGELKVAKETRPIKGGFILRDGLVEINSSFEAILKYNQNELESDVIALLLENS